MTLKAGQDMQISSMGVHLDPENYPDPFTFNPENFSKENK